MPRVWDVVCAKCNRTFCYDCAVAIKIPNDDWYLGLWFCHECAKNVEGEVTVGQREDA